VIKSSARDLPDIPKSIVVLDNIFDENTANYIEKYFLQFADWKYSSVTSFINTQNLKDTDLKNINEKFQMSCLIDFNPEAPSHSTKIIEQTNTDHLPVSLIPLNSVCIKQNIALFKDCIIRIKANLQTKNVEFKKNQYNIPHVDTEWSTKSLTMIYYVNDSDGDTFFFEESFKNHKELNDAKFLDNLTIYRRVSPKKGRVVLFRSDFIHAGSHPKENETRIVLNYNFFPIPGTLQNKIKNIV
jgi:hypothetical protein